ncbi:hypothetical protein ACFX1X_035135 [Malus domestica]
MSIATQSTSSFSSALSIRGSSFSSVPSFSGSTFGSTFSSCCAFRRMTSVAIYMSFSSMVLVNLVIALLICANCSLIEVAPVIMTCMATGYDLLLESTSEVNDLRYLIELSSLGTLNEASVITGSCLKCSYSFS